MTKDEFVALCKELLELGATDVSGGIFRAQFRPAQAPPRRGEERASNGPSGPPKAQSPDEARHGYYRRVMGGGGDE